MSKIADFTAQGYEIIEELGRNREGGRITWKAKQIDTEKIVVIKQFCFATAGSNWSDFQGYEREIKILQSLNNSGIPKYLDSFTTDDGFCLIQEYKDAVSLSTQKIFSTEEIKIIVIKILEILVYLQNKLPPILHRDIKPENILVDENLNVYLVDFGFASIGSKKVSVSSIFKGTPGFIAPEQIIRPTLASDLYGLGVTIICLLTGISSWEIQDLASSEDPYKLNFQHLLSQLSLSFIAWLEKMIAPQIKDRFQNAKEALEKLIPLDLIRTPEAQLSNAKLTIYAHKFGETLRETIIINNDIPETTLHGKWSVLPHPSDPPHTPDNHAWIKIKPKQFKVNKIKCQIFIDTSNLISGKLYQRDLVLETNAIPENYYVTIKLHTAPLAISLKQPAYLDIGRLLLLLIPTTVAGLGAAAAALVTLAADTIVGAVLGGVAVAWAVAIAWAGATAITLTLTGVGAGVGLVYLAVGLTVGAAVVGAGIIAGIQVGMGAGAIAGFGAACLINFLIETFKDRGFNQNITLASLILTIAIGMIFGGGLIIGLFKPIISLGLSITIAPLIVLLLYPSWERARLRATYRKIEKEKLIKP